MNLSKRLSLICDLVPDGSNVADIGSDHGLLLIRLAELNKTNLLLGVENKKGPYNNLVTNIKKSGFTNRINAILSDGLKDVPKEYDVAVLAGMGATLIKQILSFLEKIPADPQYFLIDSHNFVDEIRRYVCGLGYYIDEEKCLFEDDIFYQIIRFEKGVKTYTEKDYKFGPILSQNKSDEFITYRSNERDRLNKLLEQKLPDSRREEVIREIKQIEETL